MANETWNNMIQNNDVEIIKYNKKYPWDNEWHNDIIKV